MLSIVSVDQYTFTHRPTRGEDMSPQWLHQKLDNKEMIAMKSVSDCS